MQNLSAQVNLAHHHFVVAYDAAKNGFRWIFPLIPLLVAGVCVFAFLLNSNPIRKAIFAWGIGFSVFFSLWRRYLQRGATSTARRNTGKAITL
jgi:hypothetical protein